MNNRDNLTKYDLFVSLPLSGYPKEEMYRNIKLVRIIISLIKENYNYSNVYFAGDIVIENSGLEDPCIGIIKDLSSIERSDRFLYIRPNNNLTSCDIELGYAIAKNKPIMILTNSLENLVYFSKNIELLSDKNFLRVYKSNNLVQEIITCKDFFISQ